MDFSKLHMFSSRVDLATYGLQSGLKIGEAGNPAGLAKPMFIKYPALWYLDKEPHFKSLSLSLAIELVYQANFFLRFPPPSVRLSMLRQCYFSHRLTRKRVPADRFLVEAHLLYPDPPIRGILHVRFFRTDKNGSRYPAARICFDGIQFKIRDVED